MSSLRLSVVVCTHNRPHDLERCLKGLAALEDPVEVIVVDSASDPPLRDRVEQVEPRPSNMKYVREDRPGLSRARNRGAATASGELIAFLDDDTEPDPDWARRIAAPFEMDPAIGCVGGSCRAAFRTAQRPRWLSDRLLQFAGITRFGSIGREARSKLEWPFGANIAFRKEALLRAGPFSEALGRSGQTLLSGEEWELTESIRRAGWMIWLEPSAGVDHTVHAERCTSRYYWRRLWWAGVSRARATEASAIVGLRLLAAVPVRLGLYALTRDRVYLYRTAETAGFLAERIRLHRGPA
jgi:glucosyl-dolichyl phosphate glucuronosyltransferase